MQNPLSLRQSSIRVWNSIRVYVLLYILVCVCICVSACACAGVCVCVCVWSFVWVIRTLATHSLETALSYGGDNRYSMCCEK